MTGHATLATGRWSTLTLAEQLANVGSEVERTIAAWEARRTDRFDKALARALELFDLTAGDDRWRGHRRREILRAREEFCRLFFEAYPPAGAPRPPPAHLPCLPVLAPPRRPLTPTPAARAP